MVSLGPKGRAWLLSETGHCSQRQRRKCATFSCWPVLSSSPSVMSKRVSERHTRGLCNLWQRTHMLIFLAFTSAKGGLCMVVVVVMMMMNQEEEEKEHLRGVNWSAEAAIPCLLL